MHYRLNFLTNVVFRLDFESIPDLQRPERPALSTAIGEWFPRLAVAPGSQISINVGPQGTEFRQGKAAPIYEHRRVEGGNPKVTLAPEFLAIEYESGFVSYRDVMRTEIVQISGALGKAFPGARINRIGLRYVNQIALPDGLATNWDNLVEPSLVAAVAAGLPAGMRIARSMRQSQVFDEAATLVLTHGWVNPDFPGELVRRHFVLDIDAFRQSSVDVQEIVTTTDAFNERCEALFEASIQPGLREIMGVLDER